MMRSTGAVTVYSTDAEQLLARHTLDFKRLHRNCDATHNRRAFREAVLLFLVDGEARLAQIEHGTVPWSGGLRAWIRAAQAFGASDLVRALAAAALRDTDQDRRAALHLIEEGWTRTACAVGRWMDTSYLHIDARDTDLAAFLTAYSGQEAYAAVRRTWPHHRVTAEA